MNNVDNQYLNLLKDVLENGTPKIDRTGVGTKAVFGRMLRFNLQDGFPLLTTKKIYHKAVVHELLWFLTGESNIEYLKKNRITIWDEWADEHGNLGPVYGVQWRRWQNIDWVNKKTFEYKEPKIQSKLPYISPDYSSNECGYVGKIFSSNSSGQYEVIKEYRKTEAGRKKGHFNFDVRFLNTNFIGHGIDKYKIKTGFVNDRYAPSVCGVACLGEYIDTTDVDHELLYAAWAGMIKRCYYDDNDSYRNYGGRSLFPVFVDDDWLIYSNFYRDAKKIEKWSLKKEFPDKYSLDKDIKGSNKYSYETCVWANKTEQMFNTRVNRLFTAIAPNGDKQVCFGVKFFSERYGFSDIAIIQCLNGKHKSHMGWEFEEITIEDGFIPRLRVTDQIDYVVAGIKNDPDSRRLVVSAWNPGEIHLCRLPPCHTSFQFFVYDGKLSCHFHMRSVDVFLGLPFNIASYSLLTHMMAQVCGLDVGEVVFVGVDVHIYNNHFNQVNEQLTRKPFDNLPKIKLNTNIKCIDDFVFEDIEFVDYECHPTIKADIAV